ncbi:Alpha-L-fucosidase [Acidisarcina polymorpha]|uniref:alpha-L-fucosidase n=1 Tax=Acidisarcina polymorpha TaxID=2211140 RepID=A0A2Z5FSD3_9BACT|nr:alpha-L-fucosidase [Acidisarcina polymorpha]AXC09719.1 Alpha-L-fucosidase [Acidisarcina polymorpha]
MDRRVFLSAASAATLAAALPVKLFAQHAEPPIEHRLPPTDADFQRSSSYIEDVPLHEYHWASERAVEAFQDLKFGLRIHWGLYSIFGRRGESWPFLTLPFSERESYNHAYQTWNPDQFDADAWMSLCQQSGLKMFAFTSKHQEGFSMFDTKTRVRQRANWTAAGGPKIEDCDLSYSIMETPFRRDVVKELTDAAHKRGIKIDLYFSHSDWYDADFRPYGWHPLQVPSSPELTARESGDGTVQEFWDKLKKRFAGQLVIVPDPTPEEVKRMVQRHRAQLTELLTNYGNIDMMCLDIFWGPKVWPEMRETIVKMRQLQPDVMLRARGIGNYGDYYTPEGFVPSSKEATRMPWFVIYPLGSSFSYESDGSKYKGTGWIVNNLVDATAKGGNFMVGVGPSGQGSFHPTAVEQLHETGKWLKVNGEGIYATRPRPGTLWSEGDNLRFTRSKDNKTIYCFLLKWPGKILSIKSVEAAQATSVKMLGYPNDLVTRWDAQQGLVVTVPEQLQQESNRPCDFAWCLKLTGAHTA